MDDLLTIAVLAFLNRTRSGIQLTESEMNAARKMVADGGRVLLTTQTQLGEGSRTNYRIDFVQEGR